MNRFLISFLAACVSVAIWAQMPDLLPKQDSKSALFGYVGQSGKWVVKPVYTVANPYEKCADGVYRAAVEKNGLKGFLDIKGKPSGAGIVFESIDSMMTGDNLLVSVKGKKGVVSPGGFYRVKPEISSLQPVGSEGYIVDVKGKKGFLSPSGEIMLAPIYDNIRTDIPDYFIITKGGKVGITSRRCLILLEPKDFTAVAQAGDFWQVFNKDKMGLYDLQERRLLVKPDFGKVLSPVNVNGFNFFPVCKTNGKWGIIDQHGKEVVKCKNQALIPIPALNVFMVRRNGVGERLWIPSDNVFLELESFIAESWGPFRRIKGTVAKPTRECPEHMVTGLSMGEFVTYDSNYESRRAAYNSLGDNKSFSLVVDNNGTKVGVSPEIKKFGNMWAVLPSSLHRWVIYSSDGDPVKYTSLTGDGSVDKGWLFTRHKALSPKMEEYEVLECSSDLVFMRPVGGRGWSRFSFEGFDKDVFDEVVSGEHGAAAVKRGGKWGLYTTKGLEIACEHPTPLTTVRGIDGIYRTGDKGNYGLVDAKGNVILENSYDDISSGGINGCLKVMEGEFMGMYDMRKGEWFISPERGYSDVYSSYINYDKDCIWIERGNLRGVINVDGKEIVPPVYEPHCLTYYESERCFSAWKGNGYTFYKMDGTKFTPTPSGKLSDTTREGDRYYYDRKGDMQWVDIDCVNLTGHTIKLIAVLCNDNGSAHVSKSGDHLRDEFTWVVDAPFWRIDDRSFFFPYSFISQPRYSTRTYIVKYTLYDVTAGNKVLDKATMKFGMTRS